MTPKDAVTPKDAMTPKDAAPGTTSNEGTEKKDLKATASSAGNDDDDLDRDGFGDDDDDDDFEDDDRPEISADEAISQLEELITYVAKALVDVPDEVKVEAVDGDRSVIFELMVAPKDLGKVIGREGRTARAMRTLLSATSAKLRKRAVLDIIED